MSANTGGPAFPEHTAGLFGQHVTRTSGMTLLDWFAGQEELGDEDFNLPIFEHYGGPRPSGDWQNNPIEWYEWQARWRAGMKYARASAMLAEKQRRESEASTQWTGEAVETKAQLHRVHNKEGAK